MELRPNVSMSGQADGVSMKMAWTQLLPGLSLSGVFRIELEWRQPAQSRSYMLLGLCLDIRPYLDR